MLLVHGAVGLPSCARSHLKMLHQLRAFSWLLWVELKTCEVLGSECPQQTRNCVASWRGILMLLFDTLLQKPNIPFPCVFLLRCWGHRPLKPGRRAHPLTPDAWKIHDFSFCCISPNNFTCLRNVHYIFAHIHVDDHASPLVGSLVDFCIFSDKSKCPMNQVQDSATRREHSGNTGSGRLSPTPQKRKGVDPCARLGWTPFTVAWSMTVQSDSFLQRKTFSSYRKQIWYQKRILRRPRRCQDSLQNPHVCFGVVVAGKLGRMPIQQSLPVTPTANMNVRWRRKREIWPKRPGFYCGGRVTSQMTMVGG